MDRVFLRRELERFYLEDVGYSDITTDNLPIEKKVEAKIIAKDQGIVAGTPFIKELFSIVDPSVEVIIHKTDGELIQKGDTIISLKGCGKSILKAERTGLNILQRLSGIATKTSEFVKVLEGSNIKLLDTRKTTPGFRAFEKYAVKVGGGYNHRFALYDMVMLKDNHIALVGGIKEAVKLVRKKVSPMVKIEVETNTLQQVQEAVEANVDVIMLDNMDDRTIKEALKIISEKAKVEVSGNITLERLKTLKNLPIDFVSTGAPIHSSRWLDISLTF